VGREKTFVIGGR